MRKSLYLKRFLAAFLVLLVAAAAVVAVRAFLIAWLPAQSWYVGGEHDRHPFVFDDETRIAMWESFVKLFLAGATVVSLVNAFVAAALKITRMRNRLFAASTATVLFLPFWMVAAGPWTYVPWFGDLFILGFHATAVLLFYAALTALSRFDRRHWGLWRQIAVERG
ncbi:MAG: hypothetical protein E6Q30_00515 [Aquabacterium sp.]|nr:MAG: hypothetical protein E6Q30_00515 [Aquabacterium sp.]